MAPRDVSKPPGPAVGRNNSKGVETSGPHPSSSVPQGAFTFTGSTGAAFTSSPPSVILPKSGGAVRKIDEKFEINPASGSCTLAIPITVSKARSASASPSLSLSYNSGAGNGPFGLGWGISVPTITRKTDRGVPRYIDGGNDESDVFVFSGSEDLVPRLKRDSSGLVLHVDGKPTIDEAVQDGHVVRQYLPRIESAFSRIERWTNIQNDGDVYWHVMTADNHIFVFGKDDFSRVASGDGRTFSWLLSQSYDSYGNAVAYSYKAEDSVGVPLLPSERNRTEASRSCNRYLKAIKYGNRAPNRNENWEVISTLPSDTWMFEIVFDYGEHSLDHPTTESDGNWACRQDAFSTYRAGFEVRTYRLCRRVLMFHHFPDELGVGDSGYLVTSTNFEYDENGVASLLKRVSSFGYVLENGTYSSAPMPALTLEYSKAPGLEDLVIHDSDAPFDFAGNTYQWVDLDSEGLPGVLFEQAGGWFYRRNLSANNFVDPGKTGSPIAMPRFGPLELVNSRPAPSLTSHSTRLADLGGTGEIDLVDQSDGVHGFYERTTSDGWTNFRPFTSWPNIDFSQPNVQFVDLTGNGLADIMVTEDEAFSWFQSLGKEGYDQARRTFQSFDEEKGPKLVFTDSLQTIYLSDFSGDGLPDLVRIRNGDICYWPNMGYGHFGKKVTMNNAPRFDSVDQFTHDRLRLSDIDGSGATDLIYLLPAGGATVYKNLAGNGWSDGSRLRAFPQFDNISTVSTIDLLGNGCACLVWAGPLSTGGQALRYIDLVNGQKPFLLTRYTNDLGLETKVLYTPSTRFYLDGHRDGRPWITRLPFPVHCVQKIEVFDHVSKSYFTTRYAYHHGFYDRAEREFRGFGMVEQWDTEEYNSLSSFPGATNTEKAYFVPPSHKKTWFHTGAYMVSPLQSPAATTTVSNQFIPDYFQSMALLADSLLPPNLIGSDNYHEAFRSLKGMILREELYADDDSPLSSIPFRVSEKSYTIEAIQPCQLRSHLHHAVFLVKTRESITVNHERELDDPRTTHTIDLQFDPYGNVLKSVEVCYGRRPSKSPLFGAAKAIQEQTHLIYSEHDYTNPIDSDVHINPRVCEIRDYHLTGFTPTGSLDRFSVSDFAANSFRILAEAEEILYEQSQAITEPPVPQKRLVKCSRALYRSDDLTRLLPKGTIESLVIPGESYELALTPGLVDKIYKRTNDDGSTVSLIPNVSELLAEKGGYVEIDNNWWIPSGRQGFYPTADADVELAEARAHFFVCKNFTDQFGQTTTVDYDAHNLLPVKLTDPLGNTTSVLSSYTHLRPYLTTDANGNRSQIIQNPLGEIVGTATMGKAGGQVQTGDSLAGFNWAVSGAQEKEFLANPKGKIAAYLLGKASTRIIFINNYSPTTTTPSLKATISRETHESDLTPSGSTSRLFVSFTYFDGLGRKIQVKAQAEDGPLVEGGPSVERWRGSGWIAMNNKGLIVKQYEPFFDPSHDFRNEAKYGISKATLFYDPLGRPAGMLSADHAWTKTVYRPWKTTEYDTSDNVLQLDPRKDLDVGHFFQGLKDETLFLPTWYSARIDGSMGPNEKAAASKTSAHNNTPTVTHLDSIGRGFVSILDNGTFGSYANRSEFDITGNIQKVIDAQGREIVHATFDMCKNVLYYSTMDFGQEWYISDISGRTLLQWQDSSVRIRTEYDKLRRPVGYYIKPESGPNQEILFQKLFYGESEPDAVNYNLRGKLYKLFDQSGFVTSQYDFKGNIVRTDQQLLRNYKSIIDWNGQHELEDDSFTKIISFDALNRITELINPDSTVIRYGYNNSTFLFSVETKLPTAARDKQTQWTPIVTRIDYNAEGKKTLVSYGNHTKTKYTYDPRTFRVRRIQTCREIPKGVLQDLNYTYDPRGSITHIEDKAQQETYFRNNRVDPSKDYTYDAVNRLIESSGRKDLGRQEGSPVPYGSRSIPRVDIPGDGSAIGTYAENYSYDCAGNILTIQHSTSDAKSPGWTRRYSYNENSPLDQGRHTNRLSSTEVGKVTEHYSYDVHGNLVSMPGFSAMQWDFQHQLRKTSRQVTSSNDVVPETTYYVYDSNGNRVRKVTERCQISCATATRSYETLYIGGFEVFRKYLSDGASLSLERKTISIQSEKQICRVETEHKGVSGIENKTTLLRYQVSDHLGSVAVELDNNGNVLSYEEYSAFGQTTYRAAENSLTKPKGYRFSGKEKDLETGLYYFGARYYAPWLGRWISPDPVGIGDGPNAYCYVSCNPVLFVDPDGRMGEDSDPEAVIEPPKNQPNTLFDISHSVVRKHVVAADKEKAGKDSTLELDGAGIDHEVYKVLQENQEKKVQDHGGNGAWEWVETNVLPSTFNHDTRQLEPKHEGTPSLHMVGESMMAASTLARLRVKWDDTHELMPNRRGKYSDHPGQLILRVNYFNKLRELYTTLIPSSKPSVWTIINPPTIATKARRMNLGIAQAKQKERADSLKQLQKNKMRSQLQQGTAGLVTRSCKQRDRPVTLCV